MVSPQTPTEPWRQNRRRTLLTTFVIVLTLVGLLTWFLLHPSSNSSPARKVKNAIFGPRITEAAEQFAAEGNGGGGRSGSGEGQAEVGGSSQAASTGTKDGPAAQEGHPQGQGRITGKSSSPGSRGTPGGSMGGGDPGGSGHGQGTPLSGPVTGPANPHDPTNNPAEWAAPEARSIGWLDRFFGTQPPPDRVPIRAGPGGTGVPPNSAGNSNAGPVLSTSPPVAAEFTTTNPTIPSAEVALDEPPSPTRSTNRAAQGNSTLNDNFEQLLRQHRAGSGDVRISLMWSNKNDLDLHVVDPRGEEIFYGHRFAQSGGLLDIDMNASPPLRVPAVENVFWPQRAAPPGQYLVFVNHYRRHDPVDLTPFTVRVLVRGQTTDINGNIRFGDPKKQVYQFNLTRSQP